VTRDPRYDVLFEPVRIGPVTAKNRFYQVAHCNGMGYARPRAHAAMRGVKAEGGWSVVSTEEVEIHPSSDVSPFIEGRLWDDRDIREYRRWHRDAALRTRRAGFNIICVYAGHGLSLAMHFLQNRHNHRTDEYGGSLVNRVRLLRELIDETKDAVGVDCAVALRFAVDELRGTDGISAAGEGREIVEMLADLPDLWDVNISDWANDSKTSRFAPEGYQ
jgi:dimethylamine/trimethylamine dehydrogenase